MASLIVLCSCGIDDWFGIAVCWVQSQLQLSDAVAEVRQAISRLIVNPPDFSQVVVRLVELFSTKMLDETTLAAIVEEIFVQVQIWHR